jgi:predicted metal-dependent hydrolase
MIKVDKIIRSNRKTISLEIDNNARLVIRTPKSVSKSYINKLVESKKSWIQEKQKLVQSRNMECINNSEFKNGKTYLFLGNEHKLVITDKVKNISLSRDTLYFPLKNIDNAEQMIISWYKKTAREILSKRLAELASLMGLSYNKMGITSAQKRWGSCSSKGNINFSYKLIMAPPDVIDYVVVHELMHLKVLNHSKEFWDAVASVMPDYKERLKWLKDNQHRMNF